MDEMENWWAEMSTEWIASRWPRPEVPVAAVWGNHTPRNTLAGIVVLYENGTVSFFLDRPLPVRRMQEVQRLISDRVDTRASGVRLAVDVKEEDLGASAEVVAFRPRSRRG